MPIDIVKKNKKNPTVVLRRGVSKEKKEKKSLEERLEKRFSHLPELAYKQKVKVMWTTVIFCSGVIVVFWFYLVSRGVIFRMQPERKEENSLIKLSELTYSFNKLKDITVNEISGKKDVILNLKKKLEVEVAKSEVINSLKDSLEKQAESGINDGSGKVVSSSGDLIVTYPLPDYYINNPVKILGRGKLPSGNFKASLEDSDGKILGESSGTTEKEQIISAFSVDLSYSNPETETGTLRLYTLGEDGETKENLISLKVNFIMGLSDWDTYSNEEFGVEFKHPKNLPIAIMQDGLYLEKDGNKDISKSEFYFGYFNDIKNLQKYYAPELLGAYDNFGLFLDSGNLGEVERSTNIAGLEFKFVADNDIFYRIFEKNTGEIFVIKFGDKEVLDKILVTFKTIESDLESWKEYQDTTGEISFKYPATLNESDELGQFIFREESPDGFSLYFFSIEPQIDNLEKWIKDSSVNLEEEVVKSEDVNFGDAVDGVYYEAKEIKDNLDEGGEGQDDGQMSCGYIFNHYGVTYSLRTNKSNFKNTFKNILGSIKFNDLVTSNQ